MQLVGESVAAVSGTQWNHDFLAFPGNRPNWVPKWGFKTEAPTFDPRFDIGGQFGGWHYGVKAYGGYGGDVGSDGEAKRGPDVNGYCDFAGVFGTGIFVTGVAGTSVNNVGVYGQAGEGFDKPIPENLFAGVVGASNTGRGIAGWSIYSNGVVGMSHKDDGVFGISDNYAGVFGKSINNLGVFGQSTNGTGVSGWSKSGIGIFGVSVDWIGGIAWSDNASGLMGWSGAGGPPNLPGFNTTTAGVFGSSDKAIGVVGTSNALMGVYGYSTNSYGVVGRSANPRSYGGYFFGNVHIQGTVSYGFTAAVVAFPDGTQRVLHGMESPDHWFEDFGTARLKRGRVVVKIDADFAKVIKRGDYRVFLTPEGDCRGLYLGRKRAASFEVRELARGRSNVAFSYRIVGRRRDIRNHTRFAKIDTRLSVPVTRTRAPRKRAPTAVELRAFLARLQKMRARTERQKSAKPNTRLGALRKRSRPRIRPQL